MKRLLFLCLVGGLVFQGGTANAEVAPTTTTNVKQNVVKRTDCNDLKAQITSLAVLEDLDDATATKLKDMQALYRRDCTKSASGRRTANRVIIVNASAETVSTEKAVDAETKSDSGTCTPDENGCCPGEVYTDMGDLGFNCCPTDGGMCMTPMPVPDKSGAGCKTPDENGCCPGEVYTDMGDLGFNCCPTDGGMCMTPMAVEKKAPEMTEEEKIAAANAMLEKGLCTDGTKPNKYGCCGKEIFKDLGNTVFACCPSDGGDCYPPIETDGAL